MYPSLNCNKRVKCEKCTYEKVPKYLGRALPAPPLNGQNKKDQQFFSWVRPYFLRLQFQHSNLQLWCRLLTALFNFEGDQSSLPSTRLLTGSFNHHEQPRSVGTPRSWQKKMCVCNVFAYSLSASLPPPSIAVAKRDVENTQKLYSGLTIQFRPCRPKASFGLVV